jgi:hypothetical protein
VLNGGGSASDAKTPRSVKSSSPMPPPPPPPAVSEGYVPAPPKWANSDHARGEWLHSSSTAQYSSSTASTPDA